MDLCIYFLNKKIYTKNENMVSPLHITYIIHSIPSLFSILWICKGDYIKRIEKETLLNFKNFLKICFLLSLVSNVYHIPRYYAMNVLPDITIVSIYSLSVTFSYFFWNFKKLNKINVYHFIFIILSFFGSILILWNFQWLHIFCILGSFLTAIHSSLIKYFINKHSTLYLQNSKLENNVIKFHQKMKLMTHILYMTSLMTLIFFFPTLFFPNNIFNSKYEPSLIFIYIPFCIFLHFLGFVFQVYIINQFEIHYVQIISSAVHIILILTEIFSSKKIVFRNICGFFCILSTFFFLQ